MKPKSIKLNHAQKQMLTQMLGWRDYCYGYWYFEVRDEEDNFLEKKELKKHMKPLLDIGLVKCVRGLLDDEGQVCGSGFSIVAQHRQTIEKALGLDVPMKDVLEAMKNSENEFIKNLALLYESGTVYQSNKVKDTFSWYFEATKNKLQDKLLLA